MSNKVQSLGLWLSIDYMSEGVTVSTDGNPNLKRFEEFCVDQSGCLIGREASRTDVHINDGTGQVSRNHIRIRWKDGLYYLEDLNSRNKTFIQYEPEYMPVELQDEKKTEIQAEPGKLWPLSKGKFSLAKNVIRFCFSDPNSTRPQSAGVERDELILKPYKYQLEIKGIAGSIPLAPREYALLEVLMKNIDPVSYYEIIVRVWGEDQIDYISNDAVNDLKGKLSKRLKDYDPRYLYIKACRGIGYKFERHSPDSDTQSSASK